MEQPDQNSTKSGASAVGTSDTAYKTLMARLHKHDDKRAGTALFYERRDLIDRRSLRDKVKTEAHVYSA